MEVIIDLKLGISYDTLTQTNVDLSNYGMTKEVWSQMSSEEQDEWLYENVIDNYDLPSWVIESKT